MNRTTKRGKALSDEEIAAMTTGRARVDPSTPPTAVLRPSNVLGSERSETVLQLGCDHARSLVRSADQRRK